MATNPSTNGSTNGYLTREQSDKLCYFDIDLEGFGKVKFRKLSRAEWETFLPLLPPAADDWPKILEEGDTPEAQEASRLASATARRKAEFEWLRREPDDEQVRYQARRNDIAFRTIASCCLFPTYTVAQARALGDDADALYLAIMTKSGLYKEPVQESKAPPQDDTPLVVDDVALADAP